MRHPHDDGVWLGGYDAVFGADHAGGYDAVISLCRMGSERLESEHIEFWLIDDGPAANPNLEFLVDDAARTIRTLRAEGKKVLVHCVEGSSRTPAQSNTDLARSLRGPRTPAGHGDHRGPVGAGR